jgi:hypothetical protein
MKGKKSKFGSESNPKIILPIQKADGQHAQSTTYGVSLLFWISSSFGVDDHLGE